MEAYFIFIFPKVPLFAQSVPEKYSIAAYITVAIQVGNIVTFAFVFTQSCCYIKPSIVVFVVFLLAHATCILSGTLWEKVAIIAGEPRRCGVALITNLDLCLIFCRMVFSVALIAVSVLAGVVGSLSMVSMYPFAAHYGYKAIGALSTGSGCNGLVTSITAFIQQQTAGGDSQGTVLFAVLPFYLIIEGFIVLGTLAFLGLLLFPRAQEILLDHANPQGNNYKKLEDEATDTQAIHPILHGDTIQQTGEVKTGTLHVAGKIKSVLLFKVWIAFLNFLLAGTLPYSLSGFGEDLSKSLYFWAVVSGVAIQAIGRLVTLAFQWDAIALQTALQVRVNTCTKCAQLSF
jgi:hypothetical protein